MLYMTVGVEGDRSYRLYPTTPLLEGWTRFAMCESSPDDAYGLDDDVWLSVCHDGWDVECADAEGEFGEEAVDCALEALRGWSDRWQDALDDPDLDALLPAQVVQEAVWADFLAKEGRVPDGEAGWPNACDRAKLALPSALRSSGRRLAWPEGVLAALACDNLDRYALDEGIGRRCADLTHTDLARAALAQAAAELGDPASGGGFRDRAVAALEAQHPAPEGGLRACAQAAMAASRASSGGAGAAGIELRKVRGR